jgi:hypothetical protein
LKLRKPQHGRQVKRSSHIKSVASRLVPTGYVD